MVVGCGDASEFERLPAQPPTAMSGDEDPSAQEPATQAPMPCTEERLEPATAWTGIDDEDGLFRVRLSTQQDVCEETVWWGGWSLSLAFTQGRPVPGTYDLGEDDNLQVRASHAVGKTSAMPTYGPPGRLQVFEVFDDGTIEGALCDVVIDRDIYDDDESQTLTLTGRFIAGPC